MQRIDSYLIFYDLYLAVIKAMESISMCNSEYGEWSWDSETLTKANGFRHQVSSFEFLVSFNITMRIFSSLRSLTVNLQKKTHDILAAYEHVSDVQLEMELLKINCEEEFMFGLMKLNPLLLVSTFLLAPPELFQGKSIEVISQQTALRCTIDGILWCHSWIM